VPTGINAAENASTLQEVKCSAASVGRSGAPRSSLTKLARQRLRMSATKSRATVTAVGSATRSIETWNRGRSRIWGTSAVAGTAGLDDVEHDARKDQDEEALSESAHHGVHSRLDCVTRDGAPDSPGKQATKFLEVHDHPAARRRSPPRV
jgi:hypothetical protein